MRKISISTTSQGVTEWTPVDRRGSSGDDYLVVVEIEGTALVDLEFSPDRPANTSADPRPEPSIILTHNVLKDLEVSCASTITVPFQSFRLNVRQLGTGTVTAIIVQGGYHGN
jgi:hypothetical protein